MPRPRYNPDHVLTNAEKQAAFRARAREAREAERAAKGLPAAPPIPTMPSKARWDALKATATAMLETCYEEMTAYIGERSETWQESERGEAMQAEAETLENLLEELRGMN